MRELHHVIVNAGRAAFAQSVGDIGLHKNRVDEGLDYRWNLNWRLVDLVVLGDDGQVFARHLDYSAVGGLCGSQVA